MTDEQLIEEAIAAGKLRRIPAGLTIYSAEGPRHAVSSPRHSDTAMAMAASLRNHPGLTTYHLMNKVRQSGHARNVIPGVTNADAENALRVLEAYRWARKRDGKWYPTPGMPDIDTAALRERLAKRAARIRAASSRRGRTLW